MQRQFNDGLYYTVGKKYIKIITDSGSVWGFVVVEPDEKFFEGDILMAAGWSKPLETKPEAMSLAVTTLNGLVQNI